MKKYYYIVYECRNDNNGKWIKNAKGMEVNKFNLKEMKEMIMLEEKTPNLCILNYIKMTKEEYRTVG